MNKIPKFDIVVLDVAGARAIVEVDTLVDVSGLTDLQVACAGPPLAKIFWVVIYFISLVYSCFKQHGALIGSGPRAYSRA